MTTLGQVLANQENAQKSTGPKMDEAKGAVRMNALRHGLCAEVVRAKGEDESAFAEFAAAYREELNPLTVAQMELAERIIGYVWKVRRAEVLETALWDSGGGTLADMAVMLGTHARELELILRYGREAERKLSKAREEYRRLKVEAGAVERAVERFDAVAAQGKATQKRRKEEDYWSVVLATIEADLVESRTRTAAQKDGKSFEESQKEAKRAWERRYGEEILKARQRLGRGLGQLLTDSYYEEEEGVGKVEG
ncbi:MAG: hypothetical protein ACREJ2_07435 [Planctomycetota bacterium]